MDQFSEAAEKHRQLLIKIFIERIYKRAFTSVEKILTKGPEWKNPPEDLCEFHRWFDSLSSEEKELLLSIVRYSIDFSVFNLCTYFDGVQGSSNLVVDGVEADFSIYYQTYQTRDDKYSNNFVSQERMSGVAYLDLHDMFTGAMEEESE